MGAGRAISTPSLPAEQVTSAHIAASSSLAILNTGRIQSLQPLLFFSLEAKDKAIMLTTWTLFFSGYVGAGLRINVETK